MSMSESTANGASPGVASPTPDPDDESNQGMSPRARRSALIGAAAAVLLLAVGGFILMRGGGDAAAPQATVAASPAAKFGPAQVDVAALKAKQAELGRPIYWAGGPGGDSMELTITADDGNMLRYLGSDGRTDAASTRAVAMYPMPDAYAAAEEAAAREGAMSVDIDGGLAVGNTANAYNGYLAFKDVPFLIEVFDPTPGTAWKLLTEGKIVPVTQ